LLEVVPEDGFKVDVQLDRVVLGPLPHQGIPVPDLVPALQLSLRGQEGLTAGETVGGLFGSGLVGGRQLFLAFQLFLKMRSIFREAGVVLGVD
jgi:hypothetical protein